MFRARVLALAGLSALSLMTVGAIGVHAVGSGTTSDISQAIAQGQHDRVDTATAAEVAASGNESAVEVDEQGEANEVAEQAEAPEAAEAPETN